MTLNPHVDWRPIADYFRTLPPCKNCGEPAGNVSFGSAHYDRWSSEHASCPGYQPQEEEA